MGIEESLNNDNSDSQGVALSGKQAQLLYWLIGLAPIAKALTPLVTFWASRKNEFKKNLPPGQTNAKLYHHVVEDVGRQLVTCTLQFFSYFAGGSLASGLMSLLMPATGVASTTSQYIITQVAASLAREGSTVLGRAIGTPQLIDLLEQDEKPQKHIAIKGKFANWVNKQINRHFRDPVTGNLNASKSAIFYSTGTALYLVTLVALIQGIGKIGSIIRNHLTPPKDPPAAKQPVTGSFTSYYYRPENPTQSYTWPNTTIPPGTLFNFSSIFLQR